MDCGELIDLFDKIGGVLQCDYDKNIVKILNTNLKCDIKLSDYKKLELLSHKFALSPYNLEHLEYNNTTQTNQIINSNIKFKNRYLKNNEYGFVITFLDN